MQLTAGFKRGFAASGGGQFKQIDLCCNPMDALNGVFLAVNPK